MTGHDEMLRSAADDADAALAKLDEVLAGISDGDLHLASPAGGWTAAQYLSHANLAAILWLGDLERLRHDPDLAFFHREEIGHDVLGYPPPTVEKARAQVASTRRTVATCLPATDPAVLDRTVEIPDLGTMTVAEWTPLIMGHFAGHIQDVMDTLESRGALPGGSS
ncbi:MAG: DinB family protein [Acidimicrobiia bacterium]|nr:DinB family protein [Acidimicrobiia bacterium]